MKTGELLFKSRGYTPIPFLLIAIIFANPKIDLFLLGLFMIVLGEFMRLWGVSYAGAATRTREAGAPQLVSNGPFAHVRNPLYIGNILIYVGAVVLSGIWFPYFAIIVLIAFYFQYKYIIEHEEEKLEELFKEEYIEYKKSVPRLLPSLSGYHKQSRIQPEVKKAVRSERSTFISMGAFFLLFVLRLIFMN